MRGASFFFARNILHYSRGVNVRAGMIGVRTLADYMGCALNIVRTSRCPTG